MGFNEFLSKFFGNKSQRDLKEIEPFLLKIKAVYPEIAQLSDDDLREKVTKIRQYIQDSVADERKKIAELQTKAEALEVEKREPVWAEVDKIEEQILDNYERSLDEVLPEVFAIVKETALRFKENEEIAVTATDFDRNLSTTHDFVRIEGDKAIYQNHWMAGGNEITWDMVHYDVQLIGGIVLHNYNPKKFEKDVKDPTLSKRLRGYIAEMATGEGKTLVATLPVFLNALTGNGVHVVTVNDYLAKRDSEWMGPLYMFHGLSVDCIDKHEPNSDSRRRAYNADITFGTNNEFGFDYLRDNMAISPSDLVQRKHNYAIVDEVDSVLIDDARTPLIISGPIPKGDDQLFEEFRSKVEIVVNAQKNLATKLLTDAKNKITSNNDKEREEGFKFLFRSFKGMPKNKALIKFLSEQGMKSGMLKTEAVYMEQNNRLMPLLINDLTEKEEELNSKIKRGNEKIASDNSRYNQDEREQSLPTDIKRYGDLGLYFVIDEKNNSVELTDRGIDLLTGNTDDPLFFVLPDITSELSQLDNLTLLPEEKQKMKDELMQNYAVKSERVHTINQLLKAYSLFEKDDEYVVIDNKVKIVDEQTGRIMEGRRYSDGLHQAIEAKERVTVEAATQTFATITLQNYFRMYHKLAGMTGTAETEAGELWNIYKLDVVVIPTNRPIARTDMNDRIYKTKREKYAAVIEEIVGLVEQGRPVLVGTTSVEISELLSRMLTLRKIKHNVLNAKLHQREAEIVAFAGQTGAVTIATNMAGRGTDIKLSPDVKKAGGLAIIGTERHESRRVDRQLRGRAGRQGDPGSSVFFISLEDNLMRLFASDRIAGMMDRLGFKEGEMLEHSMLNKSVERAQKKVEENNFGIRKRLLEYDDVMNKQREVIYTRRRHALMGERIELDVMNTLYDGIKAIVEETQDAQDYEGLEMELLKTFAMEAPFSPEEFRSDKGSHLVEKAFDTALHVFKERMERIAQVAKPVIDQVYEQHQTTAPDARIMVPITDGRRVYNVPTVLKEAYDSGSKSVAKSFEKTVSLLTLDEAWKEHLRAMEELRQSVQNASYENKDPLLIYKLESYNLFRDMVDSMNRKAIAILMRGQIPVREPENIREAAPERKQDYSRYRTGRSDGSEPQRGYHDPSARPKVEPIRVEKRVGRNDPCPCGSGKKFKACHGQNV